MELVALQYLMKIVEAGSFAKAAWQLGLNSSTLTRRITVLEDELGLTLLERRHSGVRLTPGGESVMIEVRRMLADVEALGKAARCNAAGKQGAFRLGVRMPPVGEPLKTLLSQWRNDHPGVTVTVHELSDHELYIGVQGRRLDVALLPGYALWPKVMTERLFRDRLFAAVPSDHGLAAHETLTWAMLRGEPLMVQDWEGSHATREFYASLIGVGIEFHPQPASKQSVFGLIAAGFGVTLATESQAQVQIPGVTYRPIAEPNAFVDLKLAWPWGAEDAIVGRFIAFMRDGARAARAR